MTCPNHPLNRFFIPIVGLKYLLQRAIEGRLEESEVRYELKKIVAYADEEEFCRATEHFPLLLSRCQVILREVLERFSNCRILASRLLESGIQRAGLKELQRESRVLDTAISITFVASLRAMGPTPHGPVNYLLSCASQRQYDLVKEIAEGGLLSAARDETPSAIQMRTALTGVIQALPVNRRGEKARRPVGLDGALADLTRAAMRMGCHEGPPSVTKRRLHNRSALSGARTRWTCASLEYFPIGLGGGSGLPNPYRRRHCANFSTVTKESRSVYPWACL